MNPENPQPHSLAPGTRLGPYEILDKIGVGGMGEVYRGTNTKLRRSVGEGQVAAVSPDGRFIAYSSSEDVGKSRFAPAPVPSGRKTGANFSSRTGRR